MTPAFPTRWHSRILLAGLALALGSPVLLAAVGPPPRAEVYRTIPQNIGPFPFISREIYEETSEVDVLFLGPSLLWVGIDAPLFQRELSRALGRPARVLTFGMNFPGIDLQYVLLRDLLERRKARMVVLSMPTAQHISDAPHVFAYRFMRYGEDSEALAGLSFKNRAALYAGEVLGAPRQFLSLVRPNLVAPKETLSDSFGAYLVRQGYRGAPFVRQQRTPPSLPPEQMIYSKRNPASGARFEFTEGALAPYQRHFLRRVGGLLKRHGVASAIVHMPLAREKQETTVKDVIYWPEVMGTDTPLIGVPSATLFQGMTDQEFYRSYYDDHLNSNGSEYFTQAIAPALIRIFREAIGSDVPEQQD